MWIWMSLALILLSLTFLLPTPRVPMLRDQMPHALNAETIDVMIAETTVGVTDEMTDEMTDETLPTMLQMTTAEAGRTSTETEMVVGLEMISGCIATTCTLALVAVGFKR